MKAYKNRFGVERKDRLERIARHAEKAGMYKAMVEEWEKIDSDDARAYVRKLKAKTRTLEQMIKYMTVDHELEL